MSAAAKVIKPVGRFACAANAATVPNQRLVRRAVGVAAHGGCAARDELTAPGFLTPDAWQVQVQAQILMKSKVLVKNSFMTDHEIRAAHFEPVDDFGKSVSRLR